MIYFFSKLLHFFELILAKSSQLAMFKVNIRNTRTRCEICSKLTIETPDVNDVVRVFIVNFEHILHLVLVFLLLTLSR